jgi:hypothetical protein
MRGSSRYRKLKGIVLLMSAILAGIAVVNADEMKVYAFVTSSAGDTPRSTLPANTPKIWVIFETKGVKAGDKFRGVLIADQAGHIASENSKITEGKMTLDGDTSDGDISFTKPTNDWPAGQYHVEIYINGQLMTTVKFTVEAAK